MKHSKAIILILGLMVTSNCFGFPTRKPSSLETTPGYKYRDDIYEFDDWIWPNNEDAFATKFGLNKKEGWEQAIANASPVLTENDDGFKDFDDQDEEDQATVNADIARMLLGDILEESIA